MKKQKWQIILEKYPTKHPIPKDDLNFYKRFFNRTHKKVFKMLEPYQDKLTHFQWELILCNINYFPDIQTKFYTKVRQNWNTFDASPRQQLYTLFINQITISSEIIEALEKDINYLDFDRLFDKRGITEKMIIKLFNIVYLYVYNKPFYSGNIADDFNVEESNVTTENLSSELSLFYSFTYNNCLTTTSGFYTKVMSRINYLINNWDWLMINANNEIDLLVVVHIWGRISDHLSMSEDFLILYKNEINWAVLKNNYFFTENFDKYMKNPLINTLYTLHNL